MYIELRDRRAEQQSVLGIYITSFGGQGGSAGMHIHSHLPQLRTFLRLYQCGFYKHGHTQQAYAGKCYVNTESYVFFNVQLPVPVLLCYLLLWYMQVISTVSVPAPMHCGSLAFPSAHT